MTQATIAQKAPFPVAVEAGKDYWWCACGNSKNQPFCDGSHKVGPFTPISQVPYSTTHTWTVPGTYTVSVTGHGNCVGQVSTTVVVQ